MSVPAQQLHARTKPALYRRILLGVDASDHSDRGVREAIRIGALGGATLTGAHVYAAKMHDRRFRQMEGGLPEPYREETELERQRGIHDDLITRGLSVITASYLDQVERECAAARLAYTRRSLEGKNYRELVNEAQSGDYDLLVLGAQGLGSVADHCLGTVCERVVRRTPIDTLVIKQADVALSAGPIVVAVDGSPRAFGGLLTGIALAQAWNVELHVVSAYDPYYHYVAFNRIAKALSPEAAKIFRFKEQEKLHEDIIDQGLAKIYDGHLAVSRSIADDHGVAIKTELLDGKPHDAIEKYLERRRPALLIVGKTGIHADASLDIGGNTEHLLRRVRCAVLIGVREHVPATDLLAAATTSWTQQAEQWLDRVPEFAQAIARSTILRYAQEQGHTVITQAIAEKATQGLCPAGHGADGEAEPTTLRWSSPARLMLEGIQNGTLADNIQRRAEKKARSVGAAAVLAGHIAPFLPAGGAVAAQCPFHAGGGAPAAAPAPVSQTCPRWTPEALNRLTRVPEGLLRDMARLRIEAFARQAGCKEITEALMERKYAHWREGSRQQAMTLHWDSPARQKLERIPESVRGMVMLEVERCAKAQGFDRVTPETFTAASRTWAAHGNFHSDDGADAKQNA